MKKIKRVAALSICILMTASLFVGCSTDGLNLANAFGKSQTINSMQTQTDISVKVSGENLSKQEQQMMDTTLPMLNNANISVSTKINQNKERTYSKVQEDFNMKLGEMPISMGIWANTDLAVDKPVINEIIKIPELATAQFPKNLQGKDYMIMNLDDMKGTPGMPQMDYKKIISFSKEFQPKLIDFATKYANQFNPTTTYIKQVGSSSFTQDNKLQKENTYEIKLTDKSFKELIHYTLTNLSGNADAISFVKDYMSAVMSVYGTTDPKVKISQDAMTKSLNEITTNLPQALTTLNETLVSLDNLKILGENGITIRYTVNNDGYIVNEKGNAQFIVDLPAIYKLAGTMAAATNTVSNPTGIYTINLGFNTVITNINGNVPIVFPNTNETNSFKYTDLMKSMPTQVPVKK